ncbi:hypothetical protein [Persicobacter psychrovividus]|uniref:Uncharacterized protein n=1 Tax=Persicobacter psychrovividus TaxID=387638 RepID=A0ABM7VHU2_9BACT|nr:hypothetical protein PEPS_28260 [Persicobacter psychrovividus]
MEAKGGNSSLGSRKGHQQGSKRYFEDLLSTLEEKGANPELEETIRESLRKNSTNIEYYKVHQKFDTMGNLKNTEIQKFKFDK